MDDMARIWPIIIQFGAGAILCATGLWCGIKSNYLDMKNSDDKRLAYIFVGGFFLLLLLASAFTFWLPNVGNSSDPSLLAPPAIVATEVAQ